MKTCIACGMPMKNKSDFAMEDTNKDYCVHCARKDGSMQSFDEKVDGTTAFLINTQGLDEAVARDTAKNILLKLPAWKNNI